MTIFEEPLRAQRNAARLELCRLLANGDPPGDQDLAAFGPWSDHIDLLRHTYLQAGADRCRHLFARLLAVHPELGALLPGTPEFETCQARDAATVQAAQQTALEVNQP